MKDICKTPEEETKEVFQVNEGTPGWLNMKGHGKVWQKYGLVY